MRAARFLSAGAPLSLEDVADPTPGPLDVVVEVRACGICASDLHFIHGEIPLPVSPPLTLGHEASGVVAAAGTEVPSWREGARVAIAGGRACLTCSRCTAGRLEDCRRPEVMGAHYDGAWASLVRVPWYTLAPLPESVSFEHGAIACDAVSTPYAALVDRGGIRAGERVGLWGIGGLGTHAVQIARLAGASFIVAVDPLPEARDRASRLGADLVLDPADEVPSLIRRAAGGIGLDLALDLVGKTAAVRQAMQSLSRGGRLVVVGQSLETLDAGPLALLSFRSLALLGHLGYRKQHLEQVLDLLGSGRLDLSESVTATFPLESVNEGLSALSSKASAVVRNVVLPGPA